MTNVAPAAAQRGVGLGGAYSLNYRNPSYNAGIVTGTGADWFGPLNPMQPTAPPDVKGRILDYPSGYNLDIRPRAYENISFGMLRHFADSYDLLRILIETRKDQMARQRWNIVPRDRKKAKVVPPEMQTRIDNITAFFFKPDKEHFWGDWLRMLLEDLLVLDAPCAFKRRTFGGDLYSLQPLDGGNIKRVIDDWGMTPMAPTPAYQQVLKGYPAVDYTADELMYRPRNIRTHKVYGFGPVEQIIMTINIGMRRQVWQLESFTEGNIPEALIGTPSTWTPDQVRSFQEWFDMMLVGNTGERRRARFVPGDVAKGYVPTKPDELFGAAEEWMVRVMCYCFGVSPQPFVKMMNRATAESAQEAAAEEGLAPIMEWVKGFIDDVIITDFASFDLEFEWLDGAELDPQVKSTIVLGEVAKGLITLNEGREEMGLDPVQGIDEYDRPMVYVATGYVPFALTQDEKDQQQADAQAAADQAHQNSLEQIGAKAKAGVDPDADPDADGADGSSSSGSGSGGTAGAPGGDGGSSGVGAVAKVDLGEVAKAAKPPFPVEVHQCGHPAHTGRVLEKAGKTPAIEQPGDPLRPKIAKLEKRLRVQMRSTLSKLGASVVEQFRKAKLKKVDGSDDPEDWSDFDLDDFLDELDLSILATSAEDVAAGLAATYEDTGRVSLSVIGGKDRSMFEVVHDRALSWAKDHAAMLVGKTEDPEYSLDDSTRDMIRATIANGIESNMSMPDIADDLADSYAFSDERALTIASTEITSANSLGALEGYKVVEEDGTDIKKSWLVMDDGCPICQENADAGPIPLDEEFPSGDQAPGAHPHCRCVLVPEVGEAGDGKPEDEDAVDDVAAEGDDTMEEFDKPGFVKADTPDSASTLYVSRKLENADDFLIWAREQGFEQCLAPDDLHVTVAFSRAPVEWGNAGPALDFLHVTGGVRQVVKFDKGAVVLVFECPPLQNRHDEFEAIGCSWDFPSYHCHVTVTYSGEGINPDDIEPYQGPLKFGPEIFSPVVEDWEKSVTEQ